MRSSDSNTKQRNAGIVAAGILLVFAGHVLGSDRALTPVHVVLESIGFGAPSLGGGPRTTASEDGTAPGAIASATVSPDQRTFGSFVPIEHPSAVTPTGAASPGVPRDTDSPADTTSLGIDTGGGGQGVGGGGVNEDGGSVVVDADLDLPAGVNLSLGSGVDPTGESATLQGSIDLGGLGTGVDVAIDADTSGASIDVGATLGGEDLGVSVTAGDEGVGVSTDTGVADEVVDEVTDVVDDVTDVVDDTLGDVTGGLGGLLGG